jgi:hypothetical protein
VEEIGDRTVSRSTYPALFLRGKWNSAFTVEAHIREQVRTANRLIDHSYLAFDAKIQPSKLLSLIEVKANLGEQVDFLNERAGRGGSLTVVSTLRPGIHLTTDLVAERQWLNVGDRRLFTADVAQLKATYNFTSRMFVRAIGQYTRTRRNPDLYSIPVEARDGALSGSLLYGYLFNWQTALYAGFGDDRSMEQGRYVDHGSHFFVKIAYAFEP